MKKRKRNDMLVCGLMSGTSLDGIDGALVRLSRTSGRLSIKRVAFHHEAFSRAFRTLVLKNSTPNGSNVDEIARLNFLHGELSAEVVRKLTRKAGIPAAHLDLIGSHGQTIRHLPVPHRMLGRRISATMQIGDPSVIAVRTGVLTVGDFRVADVAAGGQGAPLVPYFDWLVFRSRTRNRIVLNIGGIANATLLPPACRAEDVRAFDTGPGNMAVDALMQRFYRRNFDAGGRVASSGRVITPLLAWAMKHPYFRRPLPKSTGREEFGEPYVKAFLKKAGTARKNDIVATASMVTPLAVFDAWRRYSKSNRKVDDVIVSGGGTENKFFLATLGELFGSDSVTVTDDLGIPSNEKEAICFAVLAFETVSGRAANLPSVTGARRRVVLGKICNP